MTDENNSELPPPDVAAPTDKKRWQAPTIEEFDYGSTEASLIGVGVDGIYQS